jgi:hypothetical protein
MMKDTLESKVSKVVVSCIYTSGLRFGWLKDEMLYCGCALKCPYQRDSPDERPYCGIKYEVRSMAREIPKNKRE